jgi:hypothetical protein
VQPHLGFKHRLHYDGGLGCLGNLLLQLCAKRDGMRMSAKEYKLEQGRKSTGLTLGLLPPASGLNLRSLSFLLPTLGLDPRRLDLLLQALGLDPRSLGRPGSFSPQLCVTPGS